MRKAFICSWVQMRLYIRSGQILFPLLLLIAYPLVFYHIIPVDAVSSFLMSTVEAFAWGAWIALAMSWAEDAALRHVLLVKSGRLRYYIAQEGWLLLFGMVGGAFLVCGPVLAHVIYLPGMFARAPSFLVVMLGILINVCAAVCGVSVGGIFHPSIIRDRKMAYLLCLLIVLFGLVDGMAGIPFALRLLLPPLYDSINQMGQFDTLETQKTLLYCLWYLLYAVAVSGLKLYLLQKTKEC